MIYFSLPSIQTFLLSLFPHAHKHILFVIIIFSPSRLSLSKFSIHFLISFRISVVKINMKFVKMILLYMLSLFFLFFHNIYFIFRLSFTAFPYKRFLHFHYSTVAFSLTLGIYIFLPYICIFSFISSSFQINR